MVGSSENAPGGNHMLPKFDYSDRPLPHKGFTRICSGSDEILAQALFELRKRAGAVGDGVFD